MTFAAALRRALCWSMLALSLGGCAALPFFGDKDKDAAPAEPLIAQYELQVDAPKPLDKLLLDYLDLVQPALGALALRRRMQSASRNADQLAHHRNRIQLAICEYPGVLHIDSFAKYAAAFFNISFSIRSRATS